ncbi:hypothetical protein JHK82_033752 [Glycine max]|nr:hypothetical protein JHK85_034467 [Glycine max]KAG5119332.1 hypothetical protein JHK82_033752 [Glycine max]KAG5140324.1 hypothetical protein JHK84_034092 [Glycine max]
MIIVSEVLLVDLLLSCLSDCVLLPLVLIGELKKSREVADAIVKNNQDLVLRYKAVINDGLKLDLGHTLSLEKTRENHNANDFLRSDFSNSNHAVQSLEHVTIVMEQMLRLLHTCALPLEDVDFINYDGKTMNKLLLEVGCLVPLFSHPRD